MQPMLSGSLTIHFFSVLHKYGFTTGLYDLESRLYGYLVSILVIPCDQYIVPTNLRGCAGDEISLI